MTEDPFTTPEVTEPEINRAVERAQTRIEEAENILWTVATQPEIAGQAIDIEAVTRDVWEIQNKLTDIQEKLADEI